MVGTASSGNPNGNPGNKGGGRKSAYEEEGRAEMLVEAFFEKMNVAEMKGKLTAEDRSIWEVWIAKGLAGNEKVMAEMFKKLFPDKIVSDTTVRFGDITPEQRDIINKAIEYATNRGSGSADSGDASPKGTG